MKSSSIHPYTFTSEGCRQAILHFGVLVAFFSFAAWNAEIFAQNMSINATGAQPDNSAMLDITSSNSGLLIPRMTSAERTAIVNPANGLLIFQTNGSHGLYYYNDPLGAWEHILDSTQLSTLPGDDLGNHTLTQNLTLSNFYISNDGGNEGISISNNGVVTVTGATPGFSQVRTNGYFETIGQGTGIRFTNSQIAITGNNGNSGDMRFMTGSNDRMRLTVGGSLGIGTLSPSTLLDVAGTATVDSLYVDGAYGLPTSDGPIATFLQTDGSGNVSWAAAGDADWTVSGGIVYNTTERFAFGTNAIPGSYFAEFETPTSTSYPIGLSIDNNYTGAAQAFGLTTNISTTSSGQKFGTYNTVTANATQNQDIYGSFNLVNPDGTSNSHGVYNELGDSGTGQRIGVYNDISVGATSGNGYGVRTIIDANGLGAGYGSSTIFNGTSNSIRYGQFINLGASGTGQKWGLYILNEDANTLSGTLGIGTSNPLSKLHVISDGSLTGGIRLSASTPATVGSSIYLDAAVTDWTITASNNSYSAGANKLVFRNYSDASDVFTLTAAGRAGLGTTSPTADFDIAQDSLLLRTPNNFSGTSFIIEGRRINGGAGIATIDLRNIDANNGNTSYSAARIETQNDGDSDDGDLRFYTTSNLVSSLAMRIDESGDVGIGIGGATPSALLEVGGDIEIPETNDYTYSAPKTNYVTVSASAFAPIDNLTFDGTGTGNARWITGGIGGNANVMYAPVNLPNGAEITRLDVYYNDTDPVRDIYAELEILVLAPNTISTVATTNTTTGTGLGSVFDNTITHTVNNASNAYFIKFYTYENSSLLWVRGARISYTVDHAD